MTRKLGDTLVVSIPAGGDSLPERALAFGRISPRLGCRSGRVICRSWQALSSRRIRS